MATPDFILALRDKIGTAPLWLTGATAVITRGNELLLVQRADTQQWTPVTGIVDPGEHPADAAAREAMEEAGVVVRPVKLALVGVTEPITYANGDVTQYIDLTFHFEWVSGDPHPADGENLEARWFALDRLPQMSDEMVARVRAALSDAPAAQFGFGGANVSA